MKGNLKRLTERASRRMSEWLPRAVRGARRLGRTLRLDAVVRWYGEHRMARMWTINIAGALLLIWAARVMSDWIQPTLTPEMLFPSATIGPEAVLVAEARPGRAQRVATYTGAAQPWEENVVYARVDGYVESLNVYPGEYVRRGQLLAKLETSRLEPQLAEALVDSVFWAAEFRRESLLFEGKAISASELDRVRARYGTASAKVEFLRTQIGYAEIRALTDGWIAERYVYSGQYVPAGERIVKLDQIDRVRIQFKVAEEHLAAIKPGTKVFLRFPQLDQELVVATWDGIKPPVLARVRSVGGGSETPGANPGPAPDPLPPSGSRVAKSAAVIPAEVAVVFPAEDPATRTGIVEVRLRNPGLALRTNTYVVGDFVVAEGDRGVLVPVQAITPMPGGRTVVFVVPPIVEQGAVEEREVVVGVRNSQYAEVVSGVAPGERVVYKGNRGLVDGQAVTVLNPQGQE